MKLTIKGLYLDTKYPKWTVKQQGKNSGDFTYHGMYNTREEAEARLKRMQ